MNFPIDVEEMLSMGYGYKKAILVSNAIFSWDQLSSVVKEVVPNEKPKFALQSSWNAAREHGGRGLSYHPPTINEEESLTFPLIVRDREPNIELVLVRSRYVLGDAVSDADPGWVLKGVQQKSAAMHETEEPIEKGQPEGDLQELTDRQACILDSLAAQEEWEVLDGLWAIHSERRLLKNYIKYTYNRLRDEWKLLVNKDGAKRILAFNTGLQSHADLRDIIAVCVPAEAPDWRVKDFFVEGADSNLERETLEELGELPKPAKYINTITDAVIDLSGYDGLLNEKHIFKDNLKRFPLSFLERTLAGSEECQSIIERAKPVMYVDDYREEVLDGLRKVIDEDSLAEIKKQFSEALDRGLRRAARNYMLAIPCYYFGQKRMAHMLPVSLNGTSVPDLALILDIDGDKLVGKTVYSIRYAYESARLIMKPAENWVHGAVDRFKRGLGGEGVDYRVKSTDPLRQAPEVARISGLGIMCEVRDGYTIGVYRDEDKPKPDIELPGPKDERETDYHFVSQLHGRFQFEDGRWYYTDEQSTNGSIHVDREGNPTRVLGGQRIELGHDSELVFANAPSLRFMCIS